jgi:predicted AlkP superfamily phosphohydrolase/phosphomutase
MNSTRVFVMGLDGATLDLLGPWIEGGELPTLRKILNRSSYGRLESTIPPISPPAWTSFMTGVNPGRHGIFDFIGFKPNSFKKVLLNSTHIRSKRFWDIAGERGKRSILLHIPLTYPPQKVEGVMISGIPAPPQGEFIYPEEMGKELEERVGTWWRGMGGEQFRNFEKKAFMDEIHEALETHFRVAHYLIYQDWDVFILVLSETDMAQHLLWEEKDRFLLPLYKKIDSMMGDFLKILREEDIFLVLSDHGFGPVRRTLYLNTWLKKKGFLSSCKAWGQEDQNGSPEIFQRKGSPPYLRKLKSFLRRRTEVIDWKKTQAYFFNTGQLHGIGINLRGREPEGIVNADEYDVIRGRVMNELSQMVDETKGKKVIAKVFRREDLYTGPYVKDAPDIIFMPDYEYILSGRIRDSIFRDTKDGRGFHRLHGLFLFHGQGIREGREIEGAHIIDMAPTILHLLGLPVPTGMDGKVLTELLEPEAMRLNPVRFEEIPLEVDTLGGEMALEDAEEVKKKLRGLGYIE